MRVAANVRLDSSLDRLVTSHVKGPVAQLGERYTGRVEVDGSIPFGSTKQCSGKTWFFLEHFLWTGVVPNIELAQQAGLDCDNGIVVDHFTRSQITTIRVHTKTG